MHSKLRDIEPVSNLDPQLGLLLAMFGDGTNEWRRELLELELPKEAVMWRASPSTPAIGNILTHMHEVEATWIHEMAPRAEITESDLMALYSKSIAYNNREFTDPPSEPIEWYLAQHDDVRARSIEMIHELADPKKLTTRTEKDYGYSLRWILHHVITHENYHGGQVVILGMMYGDR